MTEPKPCPFCGSHTVTVVEGSTGRWCLAECQACFARAREVRKLVAYADLCDDDIADAIAAWNQRSEQQ